MPENVYTPIFQETPLVTPNPSDPNVTVAYCHQCYAEMFVFRKGPLDDICQKCRDLDAERILG